ncbi:peptidase M28 [Coraliomargarita sinensis]|uniref:Peptidase M28 n=1 Tax=Coraliomargarita sinensis TaxID=2174842 RepID=A0A317ZCU4_9BACT|nr:M28 family peptidase [Coraliomargarita sinensis]PXA03025.1 peptidase M28 [Coraliomargarita sinensis]
MIRKILKFARNVMLGVGFVIGAVWIYIAQPSLWKNDPIKLEVNEARLTEVVQKLSIDFHPRNFSSYDNLTQTAAYIEEHFRKAGGTVEMQEFIANGSSYRNVRGFFGDKTRPRLVIGAHYDTHSQTPGADDNASGVAGLIELAYLLGKTTPSNCIELVAYPLEEPPFFATENMGSYIHAESLSRENVPVSGMIALEMIGYFSNESGSQSYPSRLLYLFYPHKGNFIAVAGNLKQRNYIAKVKAGMKGVTDLKVYSIAAPQQLSGIDFSDHRNYWTFDYDAVMVTDTAFYRNEAYHTANDTSNRLNYAKMADVVRAVYHYATME